MSQSQQLQEAFDAMFDAMEVVQPLVEDNDDEVREYPPQSDGSVSHRPPVGRDHADFYLLPPMRNAPPTDSTGGSEEMGYESDLSLHITPPSSPSPPPPPVSPPIEQLVVARVVKVSPSAFLLRLPPPSTGSLTVPADERPTVPRPQVGDLIELDQRVNETGVTMYHWRHPPSRPLTSRSLVAAQKALVDAGRRRDEAGAQLAAAIHRRNQNQATLEELRRQVRADQFAVEAYRNQVNTARSQHDNARVRIEMEQQRLQQELNHSV